MSRQVTEARPGLDRVGRADDVHAGRGEALQGLFGLGREVGREAAAPVGHGHGRHAVAKDVDLGGQRRISGHDFVQEVVDRALDAVAGGLAGDDHGVRVQEFLHEAGVLLAEGLAVETGEHFGPEHRVVFGQRITALDLGPGLGAADVGVEHEGLVDETHEGMTFAPEHGVGRPQVQAVLAGALQLGDVELDLFEQPAVVVAAEPLGHGRVGTDVAVDDLAVETQVDEFAVVEVDEAVGVEWLPDFVDPEGGEEDLEGEVGVEGGGQVGQAVEVFVDELGHPPRVVDGPGAGATADVQAAFGEAEVLLHVDEQQVDDETVGRRGGDPALAAPLGGGVEDLGEIRAVVEVGGVSRGIEPRGSERHDVLRLGHKILCPYVGVGWDKLTGW
ncbi:MAG: hypothetical protein UX09_C0029G0003 [Candidatus Uhrbacteria bacterium GW2011_GWE2_45_35]|uniref:Uncharacterized protein n=1 Tax=Candidatus Uhrbacteria bacterium GW2011_GWE2_45_35 TaxID=1618993 RepID=A0A0G1MGT7_9BACT|nr:MAG: hypothetical protein UX09_C0029G0003 [Candidatus Uhrbacteria bacterium GW2011_GWE2_45_35]